ncbi:hypothetical protein DH2020_023642 [Rehmannia glutinosa]|uniref:glutathione gamma-glutamylcysteinyltransferase n=1 Tax=Rehmannia glutinosa TaxID=99300 RepID=A0ABR0WAD7_REHGL
MAVAGMYRRSLPSPPAIDFSSPDGKLTETSITGPWRWFDETMLDCCEPLEMVKVKGISFGKVICLAHCAGANVKAFRTDQSSIDEFRKYVMACSTSDDCHLISSYNRRAFKQTGTGHFSPIGGYHAESDMVLILDVARFKYPPHWVPLSLLWEAMDTVVGTTGLRRGYMLVSRPQRAPALLYALSCKHESWIGTAKYLTDDVPALLSSDNMEDIKDVISTIFSSLPSDFAEFIKWVADSRREEDGGQLLSQEEKGMLAIKEEVLKLVKETRLYKHVTDTLSSENYFCKIQNTLCHRDGSSYIGASACHQGSGESCASGRSCCGETSVRCNKVNGTVVPGTVANSTGEQGVDVLVPLSQMHPASSDVLTALLLALPPQTWPAIKDEEVSKEISGLLSVESLPSLLQDEILHLRGQLLVLKRCKDDRAEYDLDAPLT